jgi:hypothetical protein
VRRVRKWTSISGLVTLLLLGYVWLSSWFEVRCFVFNDGTFAGVWKGRFVCGNGMRGVRGWLWYGTQDGTKLRSPFIDPAVSTMFFSISVLTVLCIAVVLIVAIDWMMSRRLHSRAEGLCVNCSYDLRGCTEPRCPECGCATQPARAGRLTT